MGVFSPGPPRLKTFRSSPFLPPGSASRRTSGTSFARALEYDRARSTDSAPDVPGYAAGSQTSPLTSTKFQSFKTPDPSEKISNKRNILTIKQKSVPPFIWLAVQPVRYSLMDVRHTICKSFFNEKPFEELSILDRYKVDTLVKEAKDIILKAIICVSYLGLYSQLLFDLLHSI